MRKYLLTGAATAALILTAGGASADVGTRHIPLLLRGHTPPEQLKRKPTVGLCGTGFGPPPDAVYGIVSWNDTTGAYDSAGAVNFVCGADTAVNKVWVRGYFGTSPEHYNVAFYKNDPDGASDEPNDNKKPVCTYKGLVGGAGGEFPTDALIKLKLPQSCNFKKGKLYWVSVQMSDINSSWYWEVETAQLGPATADWVDRPNSFNTGCTTFDNNRNLDGCLGYTYPDFMLELH